MLMKKENLQPLLDQLASSKTVFVPSVRDEQTCFDVYQPGTEVNFGGSRTDLSPKEALFPQTEVIYSYSKLGEDVTIEEPVISIDQVLFGVRSCDAYSIDRLDEVFLTRGYVDTMYYARRANTLIVALGCTEPQRSCFCTSFGIDPQNAQGADVQLIDLGNKYSVAALTEQGEQALTQWAEFLEEGEIPQTTPVECTLVLKTDSVKESLENLFEDPYWNDLSMKCLSCGTCAFVCPTCHCFDMSQNNKGSEGYRFRTWDSCMFPEYTLMAGNHNPRPTKKERLRNRFMHKLSFFDDRYGSSMCSGCGRCIEMCPVGVDISRVIEDVQEVVAHD